MCPNRNPQSRMQHENLDVRSVRTTRPLRGVALFDGTCDLTDEDAQEATVRACCIVNPGKIILGIPRTASKSHFEFCMTLCTWQHERGALYVMILTDSKDALSEEQFLALETLHRSERSAWLGRDLRQMGTRGRLDSNLPVPSMRRLTHLSLVFSLFSLLSSLSDKGYHECDGVDSMSGGSLPSDLGDTWHHGRPIRPRCAGGLDLGSDDHCENTEEDVREEWSYEELDRGVG